MSPRCVVELFDLLQEREEVFSYDLTFSMLQIHNEAIYDLIGMNPIVCMQCGYSVYIVCM